MTFYHVTRDGQWLRLKDMSDSHLLNTIALFRRKAKDGIRAVEGGGVDADDIWFEVYTVQGVEAEEEMNLDAYLKEAKRRKLEVS